MLYLAFIFHMHQPYYVDLLKKEASLPWVRLHATKDYSDMLLVLEKYPRIKQVFNLVPSLIEQIEEYSQNHLQDTYQKLSLKKVEDLSAEEKNFVLQNFFSINPEKVISLFPRYYQLYLKKINAENFSNQDLLDLIVWFNLSWIDPHFRQNDSRLRNLISKARFFTQEDKLLVLSIHQEILENTLSLYRRFFDSGQVELTTSPFYHPISPLLVNTKIALEANPKTTLPEEKFTYPEDLNAQLASGISLFEKYFGQKPQGLWPSEQAVSKEILPFIKEAGINWIVADEAILFKSLKKKRKGQLLYQPYKVKFKDAELNIVFRDRNLSDVLSFVYHRWRQEDAVEHFLYHLKNIAQAFKEDCLVVIAMDGENAWEFYRLDGHPFLNLLYEKLSQADFLRTTTISEYLKTHPPKNYLTRLKPGSWINADFRKWIGNPYKNKAWNYLAQARKELENAKKILPPEKLALAYKQMYILEGSDWFWWYGEQAVEFDKLFRTHLSNFYRIIDKEVPAYLNQPLEP